MNRHLPDTAGFSLIELMVTLAVMAILVGLASPSLRGFFDSKEVSAAAEQVYSHVQRTRMEALSRSTLMYLNFNVDGSTTWQYGISHRTGCDLTQTTPTGANACITVIDDGDASLATVNDETDTGDLVLTRFSSADHPNVAMNISGFPAGVTEITFNPDRGTSSGGTIQLTSGDGKRLDVRVGLLGQVRICNPDAANSVASYSGC